MVLVDGIEMKGVVLDLAVDCGNLRDNGGDRPRS